MREEKKNLYRSEKRKDSYKHARWKTLYGGLTMDISRQELCELQDEDQAIQGEGRERNPHLLVDQNGFWYHLWTPKYSQ